MVSEIQIKHLPRRHLAVVKFRARAAEMPEQMSRAFGSVLGCLQRAGVAAQGPAVAVYHQLGADEFDVEAGFCVPAPIEGDGQVVAAVTPECRAAMLTHRGPYEELSSAYAALQQWAQAEDYRLHPQLMWEEYWSGPGTPPAELRTDIYWPIEAR